MWRCRRQEQTGQIYRQCRCAGWASSAYFKDPPDDGLQELHLTGEIVSEHETRGDLLRSCSRPFKPESALLQ